MPETSYLKALAAAILFSVMVPGCDSTWQGPKSPDEIPDTPAELRFDGIEVTASSDTASWLAPGNPRLVITAGTEVSCEERVGQLGAGEIRLSVGVPDDARSGDVFELPSDAPTGEGPRVSISIEGNVSFRFDRGMIVIDERTDEHLSIRLDVSSPD